MRLGLAIARPEVIAALNKIRDHYNLDRLAQAACVAALADQEYFQQCVAKIRETRDWFSAELRVLGWEGYPFPRQLCVCVAAGSQRQAHLRGAVRAAHTGSLFQRPGAGPRTADLHRHP